MTLNQLVHFVYIPQNLSEYSFNDIEEISDFSCSNIISLELIKFDGILKIIGQSAFENCSDIRVIQFSNQINEEHPLEIRASAFKNCHNLNTVILPNNLCKLSKYDKQENNNSYLFINKTVQNELKTISNLTIEKDTFCGCSSLRTVVFGNYPTQIHEEAFIGCDLEKLTFILNKNPDAERYAREHGIRCVHVNNI